VMNIQIKIFKNPTNITYSKCRILVLDSSSIRWKVSLFKEQGCSQLSADEELCQAEL